MHHKKHKKAFTLVELIIVITILAILATIAFISFQGYSSEAKNTQILSSLKNIETGLNIYHEKTGVYPEPDNSIPVIYSGKILSYQGDIGSKVVGVVKEFTSVYKTPNGELFKYSINQTKDNYVVGGINTEKKMLLAGNTGTGIIPNGGTGIIIISPSLVDTNLTGVTITQTGIEITKTCEDDTCGGIFIEKEAEVKEPVINTDITIKGDDLNGRLYSDDTYALNCNGYKTGSGNYKYSGNIGDGIYLIKPDTNPAFKVYCDMISNGGGWTLIMNANSQSTTGWFTSSGLNLNYSTSTGNTFKFSDSIINSIKGGSGIYKIQAYGYYNFNIYTKSDCLYNHTTDVGNSTICAKTYETINFLSGEKTGVTCKSVGYPGIWGGISSTKCNTNTSYKGIITSHDGTRGYNWQVIDGNNFCNSGNSNCNFYMFVK